MIIAKDLEKSYGSIHAVKGLSFEIKPGESFGLLGPNGAGKSTTIGMLIGLIQPDRGRVMVGGEDPTTSVTRRKIGIAPQALSLYEELTARENLQFFGRLYGLTGSLLDERVRWGLEFAGLEDRARDRVATYSGGMKRRLNIAVALVHEPQVLLLDEPTVGVDPQSRNHIFESIERLSEQGLTILFTTHYMEEAQRLCDRVAIVDHGRLLALDSVHDLVRTHGGESSVIAELEFWPEGLATPGTLVENRLEFSSARPFEDVTALTLKGVRFHTVQIKSPDLASVFLALTGRKLRD